MSLVLNKLIIFLFEIAKSSPTNNHHPFNQSELMPNAFFGNIIKLVSLAMIYLENLLVVLVILFTMA